MAVALRSRPTIEAVRGDITREIVDAVVNAANEYLVAGGGVDGSNSRGRRGECAECCLRFAWRLPGRRCQGDPGFDLEAKFIIHTVGPRWHGGNQGERGLLASCYRRSLAVADQIGATSLAFPAISTGAFGFPAEEAAEIAVATLGDTPTSVRLIRLVAFDSNTLSLYERFLDCERPAASRNSEIR